MWSKSTFTWSFPFRQKKILLLHYPGNRDELHLLDLYPGHHCDDLHLHWSSRYTHTTPSFNKHFCKLTNTCIFSLNFSAFISSHLFTPFHINIKCQVADTSIEGTPTIKLKRMSILSTNIIELRLIRCGDGADTWRCIQVITVPGCQNKIYARLPTVGRWGRAGTGAIKPPAPPRTGRSMCIDMIAGIKSCFLTIHIQRPVRVVAVAASPRSRQTCVDSK